MSRREVRKRIKCPKCNFDNLPNSKYCSNCGARLTPISISEVKNKFEALYLLLITGLAYLIISLAVNAIMQIITFALPTIISIILGLYSGYMLYKGKFGKGPFTSLIISVTIAFIITMIIFYLGLGIRGVFGPGWVIFLTIIWKLWKDREILKNIII